MPMQFDPFREFDRLAEQVMAGTRPARPFPMDAYRRDDEFVVLSICRAWTRRRSTSPSSRTS